MSLFADRRMTVIRVFLLEICVFWHKLYRSCVGLTVLAKRKRSLDLRPRKVIASPGIGPAFLFERELNMNVFLSGIQRFRQPILIAGLAAGFALLLTDHAGAACDGSIGDTCVPLQVKWPTGHGSSHYPPCGGSMWEIVVAGYCIDDEEGPGCVQGDTLKTIRRKECRVPEGEVLCSLGPDLESANIQTKDC